MEEVFPSLVFAFGAPFLSLSGPAWHGRFSFNHSPTAICVIVPEGQVGKFIDAAPLVFEEKLDAIELRLCSLCGLALFRAGGGGDGQDQEKERQD